MDNELNDDNFLLYAAKHYTKHKCISMDEFYEDLDKIKYIKRLLNRYKKTGIIQERLVLNHLTLLYNVFEISALNNMLFFKTEKSNHSALKTFMVFMDSIKKDERVEIPLDLNIVYILRNSNR
jgi:hypothetical protein